MILLSVCLAATLAHPAMVLLAGPLILGVPHVLADIRLLPLSKSVLIWTAVLALSAPYFPRIAILLFAYLHNFVAVAVLFYYSRKRGPLFAVYVVICAALLSGVLDPFVLTAHPAADFSLDAFARTMAPGLPGPWPMRLVLLFAFTQAFHYASWLVLIPRERGVAVWGGDRRLLAGAAFATVLVAGFGVWRPSETRDAYLLLAGFHAWLELAAFAHVRLA